MAEKYVTLYFRDNIATVFGTELFYFCKDKLVSINSREEGVSLIRNKLAGEATTFYTSDRTFSCLIQGASLYNHTYSCVAWDPLIHMWKLWELNFCQTKDGTSFNKKTNSPQAADRITAYKGFLTPVKNDATTWQVKGLTCQGQGPGGQDQRAKGQEV